MTGTFEVETKTSEWTPPFTKTTTLKQFNVNDGEKFDKDEKLNEHVFELVRVEGENAIIKFNRQYSLKKTQFCANTDVIAPQTLKLTLGNSVEFCYLWGQQGTTKKISFSGVGFPDNIGQDENSTNGEMSADNSKADDGDDGDDDYSADSEAQE